jgi:hypothetical protein
MARRCFFHGYSNFDWLFAFGQVRRPHRLAGVELVFQRDDFGSDVTTGGRGLLENVIGGESGHHVRMSGHEDPQADPRDLRSGVYEGDRFHSAGSSPSSLSNTSISHLSFRFIISSTPNGVIFQVALV